MGWLKAWLKQQWATVPPQWQLYIQGFAAALATGIGGDVLWPWASQIIDAAVAGQPVHLELHGLNVKVWAAALLVGRAWIRQHRAPWDGVERREEPAGPATVASVAPTSSPAPVCVSCGRPL